MSLSVYPLVSTINRLSLLGGIRSFGFSVVWPYVGLALHDTYKFSYTEIAAFYASQAVVSSLAFILGGIATDYIGRRNTMRLSAFLSSLILFSAYLASSTVLFSLLLTQSFFNSVYQVANTTAVGDTSSKLSESIVAFSRVRVGINLGWAFGPALGGILFHYGFSLCLLAASLIMVVAVPLIPNVSGRGLKIASLKVSRDYLHFLAPNFLAAMVTGQLGFPLIAYLATFGISVTLTGFLFTMNGLLIVLFQEPMGRLLLRINPRVGLFLGMVGYSISYFSVSLDRNFLEAVITVVGITVSEMVASPLFSAVAYQMAEVRNRGKYIGLYSLTTSMGRTAGTSMTSWLLDFLQNDGFALWGVVASIGLASALLFSKLRIDEG